jgi:uncharacterized protein (TIGR02246 family)
MRAKEKQMSQNQAVTKPMELLIGRYIAGINQSKADVLVTLFTQDGVLMGVDAPTVEGTDQIKALFDQAFSMITLDAEITIDEIVVSGDYAFARSHSNVRVTVLQANDTHTEENRELFILKLGGGEWKIARYMFNKVPSFQ